ncbi:H-NS histone family protein [Rhodoferax mekongensis]|uniref:H-NS histone family protein n=1 Tax=Rhodoferax mekongensis TaxID=3068341 RepID=UPI0028BEB1B4|nr:H-NS histone family protein [Rhodoferax sp. TBRC 17199]MDT7517093.1 H-NS histone family protein [Rhodoferax sp. TBRC 17199]
MSKLIDLQSQIEKLQKQAAEIRSKEFISTVAEIQKLMMAYGITIKDLQSPKMKVKAGKSTGSSKVRLVKPSKPRKPVAFKYRGPNGETWSGRGLMPKWLTTLIANGQTKEAFLIVPEQRVGENIS